MNDPYLYYIKTISKYRMKDGSIVQGKGTFSPGFCQDCSSRFFSDLVTYSGLIFEVGCTRQSKYDIFLFWKSTLKTPTNSGVFNLVFLWNSTAGTTEFRSLSCSSDHHSQRPTRNLCQKSFSVHKRVLSQKICQWGPARKLQIFNPA